jgi:hypothetical protein
MRVLCKIESQISARVAIATGSQSEKETSIQMSLHAVQDATITG